MDIFPMSQARMVHTCAPDAHTSYPLLNSELKMGMYDESIGAYDGLSDL